MPRTRRLSRLCSVFCASLFLGSSVLFANVNLKLTAENPSELEERKVTVQAYLPAGLHSEDVLDPAGFQVVYDESQQRCHVRREVTLKPKERAEYIIQVRDIWRIDENKLNDFQNQARILVDKLQKTEYNELAKNLESVIQQNIKKIREEQQLGLTASVARHIEIFNANQGRFDRVRGDTGVLENLVLSLGGSMNRLMGDSVVAAKSLEELEKDMQVRFDTSRSFFQDLGKNESGGPDRTRTLKIEVSNPSSLEERFVPVLYFLPAGINKEDVVDAKELKVRYDFAKNLYYLHHEGVRLDPGQTQVFEVTIREKPLLPAIKLAALKLRGDRIAENLEGTPGSQEIRAILKAFEERFSGLVSAQKEAAGTIEGYQQKTLFDHAAEELENMVAGMEQMLAKVKREKDWKSLSDSQIQALGEFFGVDPATLKKIEKMLVEGKKGTGTGADIRGIRILAGTVFQGKAPSTATTWTIIYFILGFVGVASVFFIFSIFRESNAPAFDALTGLLGKKDFLRKLKQYCRHDPAAQDPCAVLMISFQNFGNVLERYGYLLGDRALKEMGYLLRKTGRVKDVVARYENNVFGIILPGMDQDAAMQVASELRKAGADLLRNEKGEAVALEISCGISVFPKDGANSDLLVKKALDAATHGSLPERSGDSSHA